MRSSDLRVEGLSFRYARTTTPVITDMDYCASAGTRVGIYGANGSGKTTFLNLLSGYLTPSRGRVLLGSDAIATRRRDIAVVSADFDMFPYLSLWDNVAFFLAFYGAEVEDGEVGSLFDRYDLWNHAGRIASEASRGMLRKVQIIAALLLRPSLLLADEPVDGLDEPAQQHWFEDVKALSSDGAIVVTALHDLTTLRLQSDDVLELSSTRAAF